jgi:hypothetical protein
MDTLKFLQRVLPSEGFFVTTVINPDGNRQGFFSTVEELATAVVGLDQRGNNTYFAISTFVEKTSRKQENVRATKALVLDVDCGGSKPFPSWKEGLLALGKFVKDADLPKPMVIHSGNGLHVYWVLDRELPPEEWKPLAEALKAATIAHKFDVDAGPTANSALVLRPVGTRNPKNGNTVRLLVDAPEVTADQMTATLSAHFMTRRQHAPASKLAQSLAVENTFPPANAAVVAAKCQQIGWAIKNQEDVSEPLWYSLLGIAAYCNDPEATAIAWSERHPKFDADDTLVKLDQWKRVTTGPTTCAKFGTDRPDGCKGCKFKDKIGSPARLGIQYTEVAPATDAIDTAANDVPVPRPYKRTADGIKLTIDDTDVDVCKFDIYPVGYGRDETLGYETVRYHWKRPHVGWQELVMRQAYLAEGSREFPAAIADQGIVLNGKHQTGYFQHMLRAYMEELRQRRTMTNLYATMGWKEDFTQFVIGDAVYKRSADGSVVKDNTTLAAGNTKLSNELYGTAGDVKSWVQFTKLAEKANLDVHMFALCVSLSSPLYAFTGLKGLTISLYGPTGGGKTLAQLWMQSVWGDPDKLHFAAKFTQNTLFSRMGLYANMPMTIDEATMMQDKDVGDFLYWVSQGRDKARLNRNAEERDAKSFAMPVTVSTNKSMLSKLISSGMDTDAQMARLLEVSVHPNPLFTNGSEGGKKIYEFLTNNYGHVGRQFIKKLLELGPTEVTTLIAEANSSFVSKYGAKFGGEERYWEQALTLADLAGRLASEWGLIQFDHSRGIQWVLAQMGAIRRTVVENKLDAFDLLGEYLNDTASSALTVFHQGDHKPTIDFSRLPRSSIFVRFDLYRKTTGDYFDHGVMLIDRAHFRKWMSTRGGDYKSFIQELTKEGIIATPKTQKAYLGKDSPIKLGQTYVVGINLNHPRLQGLLDKESQNADDLALGQLKALK